MYYYDNDQLNKAKANYKNAEFEVVKTGTLLGAEKVNNRILQDRVFNSRPGSSVKKLKTGIKTDNPVYREYVESTKKINELTKKAPKVEKAYAAAEKKLTKMKIKTLPARTVTKGLNAVSKFLSNTEKSAKKTVKKVKKAVKK